MTIQKKLILFALAMSGLIAGIFYVLITFLPVDKVDEETVRRRVLQLTQEIEACIAQMRAADLEALAKAEAFLKLTFQQREAKIAEVKTSVLGPEQFEQVRTIVQKWNHTRSTSDRTPRDDEDSNYSFIFTEEQTSKVDGGHCWVLYNPSISRPDDLWNLHEEGKQDGRFLVRMANDIAVQKRSKPLDAPQDDIMRILWPNPSANGGGYERKVICIEPIRGGRFRLPSPLPWPNPDSTTTFAHIPQGDFAIWVGSGVYPYYQDIRQFTQRSGVALLLVLLLALLLGTLFISRLGGRLRTMRKCAEDLKGQFVTASGYFREKHLVPPKVNDRSGDEIGQFAQVFDEMGDRLAKEINFSRALWTCFSDGLAITNQEGIVLDANQALKRMYGVDDVSQKPIAYFLPEDEEGVKEYASNPTDVDFVRRINRKTAEEFYVSVSVAQIEETDLRIHSVQDRTADHRVFTSMHAIGKGRILDSMMHTLGNQVHAINLTMDDPLETEPPQETLTRVRGMVAGLHHFVTTFRRLEERSAAAEFYVTDAIDDASELLRPWVRNHNVTLVTPQDANCGLVKGLHGSLTLVLLHLIENAVEALTDEAELQKEAKAKEGKEGEAETAPSPRVRVSVAVERGEILVTVSDNGPGLPPAEGAAPNLLFRWGYSDRRRRSDERKPGHRRQGTGLGLYMCRDIMKRDFQGSIRARNAEPKGAIFELRLKEWRTEQ